VYEARLVAVQAAIRDDTFVYGEHAAKRMRPRQVDQDTIADALLHGDPEVIEDYPRAERGACCLVWCRSGSGRVLHLVLSYPPTSFLITAYWPDERPHEWTADFKRRL
jgi:hypothetical protein